MHWMDWIIMIVPMVFVMGMGFYSRRYIKGVSDYLAAGRVAGRYVISVGDVALALAVITMIGYVEAHYKTGFGMIFWNNILLPLGVVMGLTGFCTYRFRETKAMSLGQFLEMRYNRPLRIYASALRSTAELLANCMCPALAARFLIYYIGLPASFELFGLRIPTFMIITLIVISMCVILCCIGGALSLLVTDTIQGFICYPLLILFTLFVLFKYPWGDVVMPALMDHVSGENFLDPTDIAKFRDFNLFALMVSVYSSIVNRANWLGTSSGIAAKTPHEGKMAGIMGTWRNLLCATINVLLVLLVIATLNHTSRSGEAKGIRDHLAKMILAEIQWDRPEIQKAVNNELATMPARDNIVGPEIAATLQMEEVYNGHHKVNRVKRSALDEKAVGLPGKIEKVTKKGAVAKKAAEEYVQFTVDKKHNQVRWDLSQEENLDTAHLKVARKHFGDDGEGRSRYQQFNTLYHQMMLPVTLRHILPGGMLGLFALFILLMMLSTDDTRLFSAAQTIAQDCVLPFMKEGVSPKTHVLIIRIVVIFCGMVWFAGSFFMAQLDYVNMFVTIMTSMWIGAGPMMLFGLYSRFGNTKGAFTSLISGMALALSFIFLQRNWADIVYPFIEQKGLVGSFDTFLRACSGPFEPYIEWRMNPTKFPINSYEINFIIMLICLLGYILVSLITFKEPFNLDRMLHRGIYDTENKGDIKVKWSFKTILSKLIGITPEFTFWDKVISWSVFFYSIVWHFIIAFVLVLVWNIFDPWPQEWWGYYFFVVSVCVPIGAGLVAAVWFITGGVIDLRKLFYALEHRKVDHLDNGQVKGNVSLSDIAVFKEAEDEKNEEGNK